MNDDDSANRSTESVKWQTCFEVSCTSILYQIKDDDNNSNEYNDTSSGSRRKNHRRMSEIMPRNKNDLNHITNIITEIHPT